MDDLVKLVECPRDAWQGLPSQIPPDVKAEYLRALVAAGFTHIDAVSFVSSAAVPQMADSEKVLTFLEPSETIEIIGIVVNTKGAERAIETGAVQTLGFPYSISEQFLKRNQNQTLEESVEVLEAVGTLAYKAGLDLVAYVSMAFGNPYGDVWNIDEVVNACDLLADLGVQQISLADTVGLATPEQIADTLDRVLTVHDGIEIGAHLHARPDQAAVRIRAAYKAGCRRFDAAIGGLGGCPFAQDVLVGNIPTETMIEVLRAEGAALPELGPLDDLIRANQVIATQFGAMRQ
jgi:hydroxymethylglutaryl-CoA lyase